MSKEADTNVQQLMHFSTKPTASVRKAVDGSFTKAGTAEFVFLSHNAIELYRLDLLDRHVLIHRQVLQVTLLSIATVGSKDRTSVPDLLAVTSESGYLTLLRFSLTSDEQGEWVPVANELIGRSGIRSTVPGEYLAVDSQGRCIFVAAPFKEKIIFGLKAGEKATDQITLLSPLEAKRLSVVFAVVAVDCPTGGPVFATLESPLPNSESNQSSLGQKHVCFYQYDTNLNQLRTVFMAVPSDATYLAPCFNNSPGVLVCTPYTVFWLGMEGGSKGYTEVPLPMCQDNSAHFGGSLIVSSVYFKSPRFGVFFVIQNEFGEMFRVQFEEKNRPIEYFGYAQPGATMLILRGGFLLIAAETGDHQLYKITRDRFPTSLITGSALLKRSESSIEVPTFTRWHEEHNIVRQHTMVSTSPSYAMRMGTAVRGRRRYFTLTHSGRLHCTSYGLSTTALSVLVMGKANVDQMFVIRDPAPVVREGVNIPWDSRIVVTHRQETTVYALKGTPEGKLPEESESVLAFDHRSPTIMATLLDGGYFLQVTPMAVHAIRGTTRQSWYSSTLGDKMIHKAAANKRQIIIGFSNGGAATITFDSRTGHLQVAALNLNLPPVSTLTIPPLRGGTLANIVGISIEGSQAERKESFATFYFDSLRQISDKVDTISQGEVVIRFISSLGTYLADGKLYIFLGTTAGQLIWMNVTAAGVVVTIDQHQLGHGPCRLIVGDGESYCYAQSDEIWKCSHSDGLHQRIPVSLPFAPRIVEKFDSASGRSGFLTVQDDRLTPYTLDADRGSLYTTESVDLSGTGRKIEKIQVSPEHEAFVIATRDGDGPEASSTIRVLESNYPFTSTPDAELPKGESIVSLTTGVLAGLGSTPVVLVGIARNFSQSPSLSYADSRLILFTFNGARLDQQEKYFSLLPDLPSAIHITQTGHVVVGMGEKHGLLMLQCGRSRFLKKHTLNDIGSRIVALDSTLLQSPYMAEKEAKQTFLLACGTSDKSVCLVRYHNTDSYQFLIRVATDPIPRNIVALRFVSQGSVACSDRFGNISFLSVTAGMITDILDRGLRDDTEAHRQSQSLMCTSQFHVGQVVNSLDVVTVINRDTGVAYPVVVYSTILGSAGCFVPFQREEDAVLCVLADPHIKASLPSVVRRTPFAHESSFYPPSGVIDGDLFIKFVSVMSPSEDTIAKIVDDARASDNRLTRLISSNESPRFSDIKKETLLTELKQMMSRTKPLSIF